MATQGLKAIEESKRERGPPGGWEGINCQYGGRRVGFRSEGTYQCTNEYLFCSESNIEYYSPQPNCPNRIANIISAVKYIRIIFE